MLYEPVTITLGTSYQYKQSGAKRRLVERCDTFQYIPFLENLEWFLDNKEIYKEVGVFVNLRWHQKTWWVVKDMANLEWS